MTRKTKNGYNLLKISRRSLLTGHVTVKSQRKCNVNSQYLFFSTHSFATITPEMTCLDFPKASDKIPSTLFHIPTLYIWQLLFSLLRA